MDLKEHEKRLEFEIRNLLLQFSRDTGRFPYEVRLDVKYNRAPLSRQLEGVKVLHNERR